MKIWGVRVYIINGRATRKKIYDRSHRGYFMEYAATKGVILYWGKINLLLFTEPIIFGLMEISMISPYKKSKLHFPYSFGKILKFIFMI